MLPLAIAAALVVSAATAQTPDQFDLVCTGTETKVVSSKVDGADLFTNEYRIDLKSK